jgi:hypothetical protein
MVCDKKWDDIAYIALLFISGNPHSNSNWNDEDK